MRSRVIQLVHIRYMRTIYNIIYTSQRRCLANAIVRFDRVLHYTSIHIMYKYLAPIRDVKQSMNGLKYVFERERVYIIYYYDVVYAYTEYIIICVHLPRCCLLLKMYPSILHSRHWKEHNNIRKDDNIYTTARARAYCVNRIYSSSGTIL